MKANLHTHTTRCGHAVGTDEEYVKAALVQRFGVLGFSDHSPWPYASGFTHDNVRMRADALECYVRAVRALAGRYAGEIRVLCGLECEYFPEYMGWLREKAEEYGLDYLILGEHYDTTDETGVYFGKIDDPELLRRYVEMTVRGLETGLFSYLAHPDLFMHRWTRGFDADCRAAARELCEACRALSVPMEYNVHMRASGKKLPGTGYPCREFFEIARDCGVPVLIGLDAHDPAELTDPGQWDLAARELEELGFSRLEMPALRGFGAGRSEGTNTASAGEA